MLNCSEVANLVRVMNHPRVLAEPSSTLREELDERRQRRFSVARVHVVDAEQKVFPGKQKQF